jgi:RecB family exonuclease
VSRLMELTARASSLADFADCPARWWAKNVDGYTLPSSPAAALGTAIHAGTAAFDAARVNGDAGISIDDAAGAVVDSIRQPNESVDWTSDPDLSPHDAERIGIALHTRYCSEIGTKRRYVHVEADLGKLPIHVPESNVTVTLTGHTDRVRRDADGRLGVSDLKSGGRIVGADGKVKVSAHGYQLATYQLLTEQNLGQKLDAPAEIIGLNTGKTPAAQRVASGLAEDVQIGLLGTEHEPGLIQAIAAIARTGVAFGNPRSMLCAERWCPIYDRCRFRR